MTPTGASARTPVADVLGLEGRIVAQITDYPDAIGPVGELIEVEPGLASFIGFANVGLVYGRGEVLVVDASSAEYAPRALAALRERSDEPITRLVYTHRHGDHTAGAGWFADGGAPEVWAHELLLSGWDRYRRTRQWQAHANFLQFASAPDVVEMTRTRTLRPTHLFSDRAELEHAGERVELRHARGETDDHCWVWLPERRVALVGDLWVGAMPNAGNPQKVQRFVLEWAEALEAVVALGPRHVLPGHGLPLSGAHAIEALATTARALRFLHDAVIDRLNAGKWPADIIDAGIALPDELAAKPYLQPIYGTVPFIVQDVVRRYAGWWSGDGGDLLPAPRAARAADIVDVAGVVPLIAKARALLDEDEVQRALHLAELLHHAGVAEARDLYVEALESRARLERSLIARNLLAGIAQRVQAGG